MTAQPWGAAGRVTLDSEAGAGAVRWAYVDGALVGWVGYPERYPERQDSDWWATAYKHAKRPGYFGKAKDLPSLDAAVMWVIRRAAADVWRQERGPVWRVKSDPLWSPDGWARGWLTTSPGGAAGICWPQWADALACAHNNARRQATP